jgi:hypothetical protein
MCAFHLSLDNGTWILPTGYATIFAALVVSNNSPQAMHSVQKKNV